MNFLMYTMALPERWRPGEASGSIPGGRGAGGGRREAVIGSGLFAAAFRPRRSAEVPTKEMLAAFCRENVRLADPCVGQRPFVYAGDATAKRDWVANPGVMAEADGPLYSSAACWIGLVSLPMPSMVMVTVSPWRMKRGGSRLKPTPPGVPVAMTSPGASGVKAVM